jgi:hypothetical protein
VGVVLIGSVVIDHAQKVRAFGKCSASPDPWDALPTLRVASEQEGGDRALCGGDAGNLNPPGLADLEVETWWRARLDRDGSRLSDGSAAGVYGQRFSLPVRLEFPW